MMESVLFGETCAEAPECVPSRLACQRGASFTTLRNSPRCTSPRPNCLGHSMVVTIYAFRLVFCGLRRLSTCRVSHARFSLSHALQLYVQKSSSHVQILHRMSKRIFLANHLYTNPSLEQRAVSIADQTQVHLRLPPATVQQSHATQQQSGWLIDLIRFVSGSLRRQQFRLGCPR
jgi:hypothetical protein